MDFNKPTLPIPKDVLNVILKKSQTEEYETMLRVWDTFIIPYIYIYEREGLGRLDTNDDCVGFLGNLESNEAKYFESSFTLTALKRVCVSLRKEVSLGNMSERYNTTHYTHNRVKRDNKNVYVNQWLKHTYE